MTWLTDLEVINKQRINPQKHAFFVITKMILKIIDDPTLYQMDRTTRTRIYSEEGKISIITRLQQLQQELITAEKSGSLNRLQGIARYFEIQSFAQLSEHKIDIKMSMLADEAKSDKQEKDEKEEAPPEEKHSIALKNVKASFFQARMANEITSITGMVNAVSGIVGEYLPVYTPRIQDAANWFQEWIVDNKKAGQVDDLLRFLTEGFGFKHIYNYREFSDLAELLREEGYIIPESVCNPISFARAVMSVDEEALLHSHHPEILPEERYQVLAEEMVGNINNDTVFKLALRRLKTYEEYEDFITYLQGNGHELLQGPQSVTQFIMGKVARKVDSGHTTFNVNQDTLLKFTLQPETRHQFLTEGFVQQYQHLQGNNDLEKYLKFLKSYYIAGAKTYDDFCRVARLIHEANPQIAIADPPCSQIEYVKFYYGVVNEFYANSDRYSPINLIKSDDPLPADPVVMTEFVAQMYLKVERRRGASWDPVNLDQPIKMISPEFRDIKSYEQFYSLVKIFSEKRNVQFQPPNVMEYMQAVIKRDVCGSSNVVGQTPQLPRTELKVQAIADELAKEEKNISHNSMRDHVQKYLHSYEEYVALGKYLQEKGINIPGAVFSKAAYISLMLENNRNVIPPLPLNHDEIIKLAADKFVDWLNNAETMSYAEGKKNLNDFIMSFYLDKGSYYIKSYEDLCQFTELLQGADFVKKAGFTTDAPILPEQFILNVKGKSVSDYEKMLDTLYFPGVARLRYMKQEADSHMSARTALEAGALKYVKNYDEFLLLDDLALDPHRSNQLRYPPSLSEREFHQIQNKLKQNSSGPAMR